MNTKFEALVQQRQETINSSITQKTEMQEQDGVGGIGIMKINNTIAKEFKYEHPYTKWNDKFNVWESTHEEIRSLGFNTVEELQVVNAMYEMIIAQDKPFNINKFRYVFIHAFKIMGVDSEWID